MRICRQGSIVLVQYPSYDGRVIVLKTMADQMGWIIDEEVLHYLAEKVTGNIRALKGALKKIVAYAQMSGTAPSRQLAEQLV